jgi:hypothetical protein
MIEQMKNKLQAKIFSERCILSNLTYVLIFDTL